jgi:hypothetical protein
MTETITKLKNIRDELQKNQQLSTANSLEKAMYLCDIAEHISLAIHHLNYAIAKMIAYNGFEEKQR